jgi:hypothetical protein
MLRLLPLIACLLIKPTWAPQAHPTSTRLPANHRPPAKARAKTVVHVVYYCAGGDIVKYHTSLTDAASTTALRQ